MKFAIMTALAMLAGSTAFGNPQIVVGSQAAPVISIVSTEVTRTNSNLAELVVGNDNGPYYKATLDLVNETELTDGRGHYLADADCNSSLVLEVHDQPSASTSISCQQSAQLGDMFDQVSTSCPITIKYNAASREVVAIVSTCKLVDPNAANPVQVKSK